jgi:hypothetical protein
MMRQLGIIGLTPSGRTNATDYLTYLKSSSVISKVAYTLEKNLVGSKSTLKLGYFNMDI